MDRIEKLELLVSEYLEADEAVLAAVTGTYEVKSLASNVIRSGLLAATDRRLIFLAKKRTGHAVEVFPYSGIASIETGREPLGRYVAFTVSNRDVRVKWIEEGDVRQLVDEVLSRIGSRGDPLRAAPVASRTKPDPPVGPRLTSFAPQLLVDDLARAIAYYGRLGFEFTDAWEGFYAIGRRDGFELHLKEAPRSNGERRHRREHEHLDAAAGVDGIDVFYANAVANGVSILKPLSATAWGTEDFYVEDPDGNILSFGGHRLEHS